MSSAYRPRLDLLLLGTDLRDSSLDIPGEFDEIAATVEQITANDQVTFIHKRRHRTNRAVLPQLLCETAPHVLHISGHADDSGQLMFAGEFVRSEDLATVIARAAPGLRCVVLNLCNGERLAQLLSEHIDAVVYMRGIIDDQAAQSFARAFYVALREGKSVWASVEFARSRLMLDADESADLPWIYTALDPAALFAIDFAVDQRRIKRRATWLADITDGFARKQPAKHLLRRRGQQRLLQDLLVPIELVEIDASGQLGIEPHSLVEIWDQCKGPLLLTGEVGSGKSTQLDVLANELAGRTSAQGSEPIPMIMQATRLASLRSSRACRLEFADLVPCEPGETHQIYLLVDAFDELPPSLLEAGEHCIRELVTSDFVERLVVTSRPQGTLQQGVLRRFQLRPWTEAHIAEFIRRWGPQDRLSLGELSTGNPLTLTLACACAERVSGGLLALLRVVLGDMWEDWRQQRDSSAEFDHTEHDIEDCCLWLLLGPVERDPSVFPRRRFDRVLRFLEREGLVCDGEEPTVPAGARWVVEYLAAQACVRRSLDLERLGGRLDLRELAKVALALELEFEPERGRARVRRIFDLSKGLGPFRLRQATLAARACSLHGQGLEPQLIALAVECLWRFAIDDCSLWKSPQAAEALEVLCRASPRAAELIRRKVASVIDCSAEDATDHLAARDGLLHISARVRAATVSRWDRSSPCLLDVLHTQMLDEGDLDHDNVPIAAGRVFRSLPRTPELQPFIQHIATHLRHGGQSLSASAAAALLPDEAPLRDLAVGMARLMELGQCSDDIRDAFLAAPGGLEAASQIRSGMIINGEAVSLANQSYVVRPQTPVPLYSTFVQRSCWQWLVPALGGQLEGLTDIARRKACSWHNRPAFTAVVRIARHRPDVLVDVFDGAPPWSLVVEQVANRPLRELVRDDQRIYEALLGYIRRGMDAKHGGRVSIIEMLEPVLERAEARALYLELLPLAWSSYIPFAPNPPPPYLLPPPLLEHEDIETTARNYVAGLLDQVDGGRLVVTSAIAPLLGAAWFHWQESTIVLEQLEQWLGRGGIHARLVAALLQTMPDALVDALRPALEAYLAQPIEPEDHEDALARQIMFQGLPRASLTTEALGRFEDYALAHAELRTTGSLAAITALCRVVEPERARELATMAAEQRLDACGFPDDNIRAHMRILAPLAPEAYLELAYQHPLSLRLAAPIFEALLATCDPVTRSELAHKIWSWLRRTPTPYRATGPMDLVGQRPADLGQEWLYHYANAFVRTCSCNDDEAELELALDQATR
jgi:hypothetical protein